jgi:hypothetical protein
LTFQKTVGPRRDSTSGISLSFSTCTENEIGAEFIVSKQIYFNV